MKRNTHHLARIGRFAALLAPLVLLQAVAAHEIPEKFEMTVMLDDPAASLVVAGDFAGAVAVIDARSERDADAFESSFNLCVALTMTAQFERAYEACNKAVDLSDTNRRARSDWNSPQRSTRLDRALALSNRGVLNALRGEPVQAEEDFRQAASLTRQNKAAANNLTRLMAKNEKVAGL